MVWKWSLFVNTKSRNLKFSKSVNFLYRVCQKDRYGQFWLFHSRGRIEIFFLHGIEEWLLGYTNIASLRASLFSFWYNSFWICFILVHIAAAFFLNICPVNYFNPNIISFICTLSYSKVSFGILFWFQSYLVFEQLTKGWGTWIKIFNF